MTALEHGRCVRKGLTSEPQKAGAEFASVKCLGSPIPDLNLP